MTPGRPIEIRRLTLDVPAVSVAFTRALRDAGLPVSAEQATRFSQALTLARPITWRRLYFTARSVLASDQTQYAAFDAVFAAAFGSRSEQKPSPTATAEFEPASSPLPEAPLAQDGDIAAEMDGQHSLRWEPSRAREGGDEVQEPRRRPLALLAADEERLLDRRFETLNADELAELRSLIAQLAFATPLRHVRRKRRDRHGDRIDLRRTLRDSRRTGGEPVRLARRRRASVRRRLVMLCDISGSMEPYARVYLQFLVAGGRCGRGAEVFVFATRLTRLTRVLRTRSPQEAIARAAAAAPDWSSGTRIGEALKTFNDRHGRRGMARGAVVVIISDGWERGDPALVATEMARLALVAHRIVWINPRVAASGFAPTTGGMRAALEHCDALLSGHTLRALRDVVDAIGTSDPPVRVGISGGTDDDDASGEETWPSATPVAGSSVAMPSGYGPSRGRTTPGWDS